MTFLPTDLGAGLAPITEQEIEQYGKTYDFDFTTNTFVRAGDDVVQLDFAASLMQSIEKELRTERHRWLAYTGNYGNDAASILRNPLPVGTTTEAAVTSVVTEVLRHDRRVRRTEDVVVTVTGTGPWTIEVEADVIDTFGVTTPLAVTLSVDV